MRRVQPWFAPPGHGVHPGFDAGGLTWRYRWGMDLPTALSRFSRRTADRVESAHWLRPVALVAVAVVLTVTSRAQIGAQRLGVPVLVLLGVVVVGGMTGVLAWRKLSPAARMALYFALLAASATMVYLDANGPGYVGGFVAASVASVQAKRAQSVLMCAFALAVLAAAALLGGERSVASIMISELGAVAFYLVGRYSRRLRERTEQAARLRLELEQSKVAQARSALLADRQRLAREMHDVLAHSLSGLLLHVESARLLAAHDPADPRLLAALDRANQLAHGGLDEARQAIGLLRNAELPGAGSLSTVVDEFRADSGIPCEFEVSGTERELDSAAELAVYRVGQEALTNIRKHAAAERVRVHLDYGREGVRLTVEDSGVPPGRVPSALGGGYGLSGMRERAELLGGSLDAGPTGTGFLVELWVPTS